MNSSCPSGYQHACQNALSNRIKRLNIFRQKGIRQGAAGLDKIVEPATAVLRGRSYGYDAVARDVNRSQSRQARPQMNGRRSDVRAVVIGTVDAVAVDAALAGAGNGPGQNPLKVVQGGAAGHAPGKTASLKAAPAGALLDIADFKIKPHVKSVFFLHGLLLSGPSGVFLTPVVRTIDRLGERP